MEKILKLAKRLQKFTPDDIEIISAYTQSEILEILDELVERNQIKKVSGDKYIFIKSYFVGKLKVADYTPQGIELTQNYIKAYREADRYAKKVADKYLKVLSSSNGLNGKELKQFVEKWNAENPAIKTSVTRINAARKKLLEEGIKGLLGKTFKVLSERKKVNEKIYVYYREFYLSPKMLSSTQALNLALKKYLEECPDFDLSTLAQHRTYQKRLRSEYTLKEISFYRFNYISESIIDELKEKTQEENQFENKKESF